jgi:GPH family glycoside/pentoside/hexuronide:cation symporter
MATTRSDTLVDMASRGLPGQSSGISTAHYLGYGVGMIGERLFRDAPALLLLLFMTDFLGIPPGLAGLAIFVPKMAIIVLDPVIGTWSDALHTRWGGRRPLMFVGAILTGLSMVAFFHVPELRTPQQRALYMSGMITLGFGAYSLFSVPYLSMASEIVSGIRQRTKMMSFRVIFMATGLTLGAFSGGIIQWAGGGRGGYVFMSWLFAFVCVATMLTTVFSTGFARQREASTERLGLLGQLRLVAGNRRFRLLWTVGFLQKMGEGVGYGSFAYFCIYVVNQPLDSLAFVVLAGCVAQTLFQPVWLWAARHWSRPTLYTIGVLGWCVQLGIWLLMKGEPQWLLIPLGFFSGMASGGFLMISLSMLSNAVADETVRTGRNQEGIYSGFWLAGEKVAFALGALVVGLMLQAFGFVEGTAGMLGAQSPSAILGITLTYVGVNTLVYVASTIPVWLYRRYESVGE